MKSFYQSKSEFIISFIEMRHGKDDMLESLKSIISDISKKNSESEMLLIYKELNNMGKNLNRNDVKELNELFIEKFNESLYEDSHVMKDLSKIFSRGKILNSKEFRAVKEYIDSITEEDFYYKDIAEIEKLMANYLKTSTSI